MKKVGIITDFYRQGNYGGILQAYALAKLVTKAGYDCEQIQYDRVYDPTVSQKIRYQIYRWRHLEPFWDFSSALRLLPVRKELASRQQRMDDFIAEMIPASPYVYNRKSIAEANRHYDGFIAGSDQIWSALSRTFLLDFVEPHKYKFSYAASVARNPLSISQKLLFKNLLPSFNAVSVRENKTVDQFAELGISAQWVLDPCLMLDTSEWNTIRSERVVQEPYVFAYFLGEAPELRTHAIEYAHHLGKKLVTLPYMRKKYLSVDQMCGDVQLYDISPGDFISLISYADVVVTDSFHCAVFAYLYRRHLCVFARPPMNMRIESLLELFPGSNRMLDCYRTTLVDMLDASSSLPSPEAEQRLASMRNISQDFLFKNLANL